MQIGIEGIPIVHTLLQRRHAVAPPVLPCVPRRRCDPARWRVPTPAAARAPVPAATRFSSTCNSACRLSKVASRRGTSTFALRASAIACAACVASALRRCLRLQGSSLQIGFKLGTRELLIASCLRRFQERSIARCLRSLRRRCRCRLLTLRIRKSRGQIARDGTGLRESLIRSLSQCRHILRCFSLDFVDFRRKSVQPLLQLRLLCPPTRSFPAPKRMPPSLHPSSPPRPPSRMPRHSQSTREGVAVATASAVDLRESGRTGASHRRVVRVAVLLVATWSARHKIAASRGKTSSLQRLRFLLALVLVPTLTPAPADLEGRPASTLVLCATPCRSSRVRAGDLQTGQYNAGCKTRQGVRSTSAQRAKQYSAH